MIKHRKIEINNENLSVFLRLIKKDDALKMIEECFSFEDIKLSIKFIFEKRNYPTNEKLEKFINRKAKLEIKSNN